MLSCQQDVLRNGLKLRKILRYGQGSAQSAVGAIAPVRWHGGTHGCNVVPREGGGPRTGDRRRQQKASLCGQSALPCGAVPIGICLSICHPSVPENAVIPERHVKLFKNGRNQAVRIPREFELPGDDAIMRKDGDKLIIEPAPPRSLLALLATLPPLEEHLPSIPDESPTQLTSDALSYSTPTSCRT